MWRRIIETVTQPHTAHPITTLNGLRGFLCLMVVWAHFLFIMGHLPKYALANGILGVDLFFCLSAFVITYRYYPGSVSLRYWLGFLGRRFFRMYPAFVATLLICSLAYYSPIDFYAKFNPHQFLRYLSLQQTVAHLWTVRIELEFYAMFFAAVFIVAHIRSATRNSIFMALAVISALILLTCVTSRYYSPYFIGGFIACLLHQLFAKTSAPKYMWELLAFTSVAILALFIAGFTVSPHLASVWSSQNHPVLFALLGNSCILSLSLSKGLI